MHPQQQIRIRRGIAWPPDSAMPIVDGANRLQRRRAGAKNDGQCQVQRAAKPSDRVDLVAAVVAHARGNLRMRELHQDRTGAGQRDRGLAIDSPEDRVRTKQPGILV